MKAMSSMDHASRTERGDVEMGCGRHTIGYQATNVNTSSIFKKLNQCSFSEQTCLINVLGLKEELPLRASIKQK